MLPVFNSPDKELMLMQTSWSSQLNRLLNTPILTGVQLKDITLKAGNNVINTRLGVKYQGYVITGMRGAFSQVYEVPSANPMLNLTLNSSTNAVVDLWVY